MGLKLFHNYLDQNKMMMGKQCFHDGAFTVSNLTVFVYPLFFLLFGRRKQQSNAKPLPAVCKNRFPAGFRLAHIEDKSSTNDEQYKADDTS